MSILSVTQVNRYIAAKFKEDDKLKRIMVQGEISNYKEPNFSGHIYFTLKDEDSVIKAAMFKNYAQYLKFDLEDGMKVIVSAAVSVYEKSGQYQLIAYDIQPMGIGALHLQTEQLKQKLLAEGIFNEENKKPIPRFPEKIGVVTAKTGAAIQDITKIIARRFPLTEILLFPVFVQGENAPKSVADAIYTAQSTDCDVLIVGRGGGSYEELSAFSTEEVVRAIYNSKIPVISAVGHEIDTALSDYAADLRAPTPSAAAEICVPDMNELRGNLEEYRRIISHALTDIIGRKSEQLINLQNKLAALSYTSKITSTSEKAEQYKIRLDKAFENYIHNRRQKLDFYKEKLKAINPQEVMSRGFSLVYKDDTLISSSETLKEGQQIRIKFGKGEIMATIDAVIND